VDARGCGLDPARPAGTMTAGQVDDHSGEVNVGGVKEDAEGEGQAQHSESPPTLRGVSAGWWRRTRRHPHNTTRADDLFRGCRGRGSYPEWHEDRFGFDRHGGETFPSRRAIVRRHAWKAASDKLRSRQKPRMVWPLACQRRIESRQNHSLFASRSRPRCDMVCPPG
jgi:hypothetical protein